MYSVHVHVGDNVIFVIDDPFHIRAQESQEATVFRLLDEVIAAELVTTTIRSKIVTLRACARGKVISCIVVSTKIAISRDLGT